MIFAKCETFDGKSKLVDTTCLFDYVNINWSKTKLCTQITDYGDNLIFEGDKLEIYDRLGDVLHRGVVHYHSLDGAFYLYNEIGEPVSDLPIGKLIGERISHVVEDWR